MQVRLAIIEHIPFLASQMGVAFFEERLAKMCITWLADSVYTIREAAIENLRKLTQVSFDFDSKEHSRSADQMHADYLHKNACYVVFIGSVTVAKNDQLNSCGRWFFRCFCW
jgi:serine/threonine-protein phosphatase 2A regulatory subunit A